MNTDPVFTVFEHQALAVQDFAHQDDFDWLIDKVEVGAFPCFRFGVKKGQVILLVSHYLTLIRLPSGVLLEILPKISQAQSNRTLTRQWVARMLNDIYGINSKSLAVFGGSGKETSSFINHQTWLALFIEMWFELLPLLSVPRQYDQQQYNHPQAQGKLLIKQQLKHNAHRPHYRFTSQQQLDVHPLWHAFFYTALIKVKSLGFRVPHAIYEIIEPKKVLSSGQYHSSYQALRQDVHQKVAHGDKQHLAQALSLAWLILQVQEASLAFDDIHDDQPFPTVMIDMNQAFEQWVMLKLAQQYQTDCYEAKRYRFIAQAQSVWLTSDHGLNKTLRPDIVIKNLDTQTKIVADVKYKTIEQLSDIKPQDLYQLAVYQQHWQAGQAWLIYPKSQGLQVVQTLQASQGFKDIYVVPFDVEKGEIILPVMESL